MYMCEHAGRICYNSTSKETYESHDKFIRSRIKQGHETPLEFGRMTVEITTSRDVLAELTRHRLASFCVQSQRYCNYKDGVTFIRPLWYIAQGDKGDAKYQTPSRIWDLQMQRAEEGYQRMIELGMNPQDARLVLPNSTACTLVITANFREWRHIFRLRTNPAAYPMMRDLMTKILDQAAQLCPCVFDDLIEVKNDHVS